MNKTNAEWIVEGEDVLTVKYINKLDGKVFECGSDSTTIQEVTSFILKEGGMPGDIVYYNGVFFCEILINEDWNEPNRISIN